MFFFFFLCIRVKIKYVEKNEKQNNKNELNTCTPIRGAAGVCELNGVIIIKFQSLDSYYTIIVAHNIITCVCVCVFFYIYC